MARRNGLAIALTLCVAAGLGAAFAVGATAQGPGDYQPTTTATSTTTSTTSTTSTTAGNVDSRITLSVRGRKQKLRGFVKVRVGCGTEACFSGGAGTLSVRRAGAKRSKSFELEQGFAISPANSSAALKLKLSKRGRRAAERALDRKGQAKATVAVGAVDAAGNVATDTRKLKLRP